MRVLLTLSGAILVAACGQTGSLYLPDEGIETPVEIRSPSTTPAAPPEAAPANTPPAPVPEPDEDDQDPKVAPPPG